MLDALTTSAAKSAGFTTPENLPGLAAVLAGMDHLDAAHFEVDADDLRNLWAPLRHLRALGGKPANISAQEAGVPIALVRGYRVARDLIGAPRSGGGGS